MLEPFFVMLRGPACAERCSTKRAEVAKGGGRTATAMAPTGQRYAYRTWLLMGFFNALPPEIEKAAIAYNLFLDRFISGITGGAVK